MTKTELRNLIQTHVDALNRGDLDAALSSIADDMVNHAAIPEAQGASGYRRIVEKLREAFPDLSYQSEDVIVDGDRVVLRLRVRGTNTGPLRFMRFPLPATGKRVEVEQIVICRVADGRIVEQWSGRDDMGMLRQLGQLPKAS